MAFFSLAWTKFINYDPKVAVLFDLPKTGCKSSGSVPEKIDMVLANSLCVQTLVLESMPYPVRSSRLRQDTVPGAKLRARFRMMESDWCIASVVKLMKEQCSVVLCSREQRHGRRVHAQA